MLQVLRPFAETNMISAITSNQANCLGVGRGYFLYSRKNVTKIAPPINCLIAAICKAGISFTAILLTTQVVPQTMLVMSNAKYPLALEDRSKKLMFKMPCAGEHHRQTVHFAIINTVLIFY